MSLRVPSRRTRVVLACVTLVTLDLVVHALHIPFLVRAIGVLVLLPAAGLFATWVVRTRRDSIDRLTCATRAVDANDLSYRIPWPDADEFEPLARAFNAMMERLDQTTVSKQQVERQEAEYRGIVGAIPDLIWRVHRNGTIMPIGTGAPSQDRSAGPASTVPSAMLIPEVDTRMRLAMSAALHDGTVETFEFQTPGDDGVRTYEVRVRAVAPDEAIAIVRDVTPRNQLEVALLHAASQWRQTFDAIDAAVIILDDQLTIKRINRAALASLQGTFGHWVDLPGTALERCQPWCVGVEMAASLPRGQVATKQVKDEATDRTWDLWCSRIDQDGAGVIIVARDISALTELQASLHRSQSMATMGALLAGVAHEVRNPLFAISALLEALAARGRDADPVRYQRLLQREVERLRRLMTDLLEYGKPFTTHLTPLSIDAALGESLTSCAALANSQHVAIVTGNRANVAVRMDLQRLARVFINLLENAIQHSPQDGEVTMDSRVIEGASGTCVEVTVRDRGPGFSAGDVGKVFVPFFSRRDGGTGLGLAIVQQIVEEHRGRVEAQNHPEGGAVFRVVLPVVPANAIAVEAA